MSDLSSTAAVSTLLAMAGLTVSAEEAAALAIAFAQSRTAVDALYRVPDVRYELPALTWSAVI